MNVKTALKQELIRLGLPKDRREWQQFQAVMTRRGFGLKLPRLQAQATAEFNAMAAGETDAPEDPSPITDDATGTDPTIEGGASVASSNDETAGDATSSAEDKGAESSDEGSEEGKETADDGEESESKEE